MEWFTDDEFSEEEEEEEEGESGRKTFKEDVHEGKTIFVRSVLTQSLVPRRLVNYRPPGNEAMLTP